MSLNRNNYSDLFGIIVTTCGFKIGVNTNRPLPFLVEILNVSKPYSVYINANRFYCCTCIMKSENPFICLMPFSYKKSVSVKATTSMRCLALTFNYTTLCFDLIKNHTSSILFHQMDTVEACLCLRNNC